MTETLTKTHIDYSKLFWLFLFGSLFGVLMEGVFCLIRFGHWETHVVSVWLPLCILYGIGATAYFIGGAFLQNEKVLIQLLLFGLLGTGLEFISGWILEHGLKMYAWDYSQHFLNYHGYISPKMFVAWGIIGVLFTPLVPAVDGVLGHFQGNGWNVAVAVLSVLIAVDLTFTGFCLVRWADRHEGKAASNSIEEYIDTKYDDEFMSNRFCEWHFISDKSKN